MKQCATSHKIYLFFITHVIKFLTLLRLAYPLKSYNQRHNFSWRLKNGCNIKIFQIDLSTMYVLFLSAFGVEIDVKNNKKRVSRMWENAYIWILKTQKLPGPLSGPWTQPQIATPIHNISNVRPRNLPPPPLGKILDSHLKSAHFWFVRK